MDQCTAVTVFSAPRHLAIIPEFAEPSYVLCELGEHGNGDHARCLSDDGVKGGAVWFRWTDDGWTKIVALPWCTGVDSRGDACTLFADHSPEHSWDVTDPTREAMMRQYAKEHPHLFPEGDPD
ncbi:hypothetical protein PUR57_35425 [Streptomyces sp. JV176]|uniref:hypothetical protein n=1 Tax=Streptomyces sp. JV176 TaxID=858630 RepID=UPI002E79E38C|nr:hypothetical protein [Streptomyces sp. JV176]MEE1803903.1 hypothetical protein [Streptomyces sp. JV176]